MNYQKLENWLFAQKLRNQFFAKQNPTAFMNLQLFASEDGAGDSGEDDSSGKQDPEEGSGNNDPDPRKVAKYSDEDLDRIISKKFAALQKKQEKAVSEAQKLAQNNANKSAEEKIADLESRLEGYEKQRVHSEMMGQARKIIQGKGYSISDGLISSLVTDDAEQTQSNIDEFVKLLEAEVQKQVKAALAGNTPKTGKDVPKHTRDEILKIKNPIERQKLIRENLELFK